jgi:hypothetical protein
VNLFAALAAFVVRLFSGRPAFDLPASSARPASFAPRISAAGLVASGFADPFGTAAIATGLSDSVVVAGFAAAVAASAAPPAFSVSRRRNVVGNVELRPAVEIISGGRKLRLGGRPGQ